MAQTNRIYLPKPEKTGGLTLEETISRRRSQRTFADKGLSQVQIGQLLWAASGITATIDGFDFRAAPSAGALYPMEIYAVTPEGAYHYVPKGHWLEVVSGKDLRRALAEAARGQGSVSSAPMSIVICAVYARVTQKYGERGIMYTHMEAGHMAQNIHLQAVSLGLGSVPVGAFDPKQIKKILTLPSDQEPLYIIPVGYAD